MKKTLQLLAVAVLSIIGVATFTSYKTFAASTTGSGMRVSPVRTDLVINPGASKTISVFVKNVTDATEELKVIRNDFDSRDENGTPALLLNGASNDKHGLKDYIKTVDTISVAPGEQKEVKVTISMPKDIPGGGYYGSVRFAPTSSASGQNISLSGSVGSLVLVRVPGDVTEKMTLLSLDARQEDVPHTVFTSSKNIKAVVRFQNEGNIQEQPFGKIIVKKGDKQVGEYEINDSDQPANVLPDSIRRFSVDLKGLSSFGKYTLEGNFGYGSKGQLLTGKTTFYIIPVPYIIGALAVIALILFLIFGLPKIMRNYNKRVLRKAGKR